VLVTKPHNKTPYELLHGRLPSIGFMRPFSCPVIILNTMDPLGEEGTQTYVLFLVLFDGSTNSQNNNKDALVNGKEHDDDIQKSVSLDIHSSSSGAQTRKQGDKTENMDKGKSPVVTIIGFRDLNAEFKECNNNSSNGVNVASSSISTAGQNSINNTNDFSVAGPSNAAMPNLEDLSYDAYDVDPKFLNKVCKVVKALYGLHQALKACPSEGIFTDSSYDAEGMVIEFNNLETTVNVSPNPITRIHTIHPKTQILRDPMSAVQTRSKNKNSEAHALVSILVDLPFRKKAVGTKWVYRNKKDERGVVVRNKTRLVAQRHRQEEWIDYDEKPLVKDEEAADMDVYLYRSMIGSLMYLTASRPDIMFAVAACSRFQVTPKTSNLQAVKRIFSQENL
nr:hypothetical protein [Tanacetum cinerariifolium]